MKDKQIQQLNIFLACLDVLTEVSVERLMLWKTILEVIQKEPTDDQDKTMIAPLAAEFLGQIIEKRNVGK